MPEHGRSTIRSAPRAPRSSRQSAGGGLCRIGGRCLSPTATARHFLTMLCALCVPLPVTATRQTLARATKEVVRAAGARGFASGVPDRKVAVLGAAGGIGQPLSLLMKVGIWKLWFLALWSWSRGVEISVRILNAVTPRALGAWMCCICAYPSSLLPIYPTRGSA